MPISVGCECGKKFKAPDALAGKTVKCPGCGTPLKIPGAAVVAAPARTSPPRNPVTPPPVRKPPQPPTEESEPIALAEPNGIGDPIQLDDFAEEVFQPSPAPTAGRAPRASTKAAAAGAGFPKPKAAPPVAGGTPRVSVSPMMIVLIVLAILIPAVIFWARQGPMKANADWAAMKEGAHDAVVDVVSRAILFTAIEGGFDPKEARHMPGAKDANFDEPVLMFKLPKTMFFQGGSSEGNFTGTYHLDTGEVEADVPLGDGKKHVAGRVKDGKTTVEIEGKPVTGV